MENEAAVAIDGGGDPFAVLARAVERCLAADPLALTDGEVIDAVLGLASVSGRVDAVLARVGAVLRARSLHSLDRARSAESWLAGRSELPHGRARSVVTVGRQLPACPLVDAAYGSAVLGTAKVELLLRARDGLEALFGEHEAGLIAEVAPLTVRQAKVVIDHWRRIALDTVGEGDGDAADRSTDDTINVVHVSKTYAGRFRLDGDLDAVMGDGIAGYLAAQRDLRFRDGTWSVDDGLSTSQRNAIILADVFDVAAAAKPATRGGRPRPSITLNWDARDLLGDAADEVADVNHRRCVLGDTTVLGRSVAERLLCSADVTNVLIHFGLDGIATPLGVALERREPTAAQRAALVARDGGCVFPGCDAPPEWSDAHHTVPYEISRRTVLHELVLVCRNHHHAVHEGGFTLTRTPEGVVHIADPDGHALPGLGRGAKLPPPPSPEQRPKTVFRTQHPTKHRPPPGADPGHAHAA